MLYDKDIREPLSGCLEERYGKICIIEEKQRGNDSDLSKKSIEIDGKVDVPHCCLV